MAPIAIYGFQKHLRYWNGYPPTSYRSFHVYVSESFLYMELGTIASAVIALKVS